MTFSAFLPLHNPLVVRGSEKEGWGKAKDQELGNLDSSTSSAIQ